ncbi:hypothetical protein ACWDSL_38100 [Streptomyces sp. NPDC000941]
MSKRAIAAAHAHGQGRQGLPELVHRGAQREQRRQRAARVTR